MAIINLIFNGATIDEKVLFKGIFDIFRVRKIIQNLLGGADVKRGWGDLNNQPQELYEYDETIKKYGLKELDGSMPIVSEEGFEEDVTFNNFWIVDPLDGTFNFVKGLGPSAVSIALWKDQKPIFGVIYNIVDRKLIWGGAGIGAYCDGQPISVSKVSIKNQASICTGFPVRLDLENETVVRSFWRRVPEKRS